MRSWLLLLLLLLLPPLAALSAARLRRGGAEDDPLPASLVHLVRNSPISSVDELKRLLQQETSVKEEEEDEHDVLTNHTHARYARSIAEAPQAQQAACKVRTEVMEVTRSMLDRRNANFMLWPTCVEVQRCSGCCNTRMLQCVPTLTSSRYLQVFKIQYINRKARYDKAIISVEDHVTCRCQPLSSSSSSSSSSSLPAPVPRSSNPNPPPALPQQPPPSFPLPRPVHPAPPKPHTSKADLHRHDDLKHNQQRYGGEEREAVARPWQQGSYTQLVHWTAPRTHQTPAQAAGQQPAVSGWPSEARAEHSIMGSAQQVSGGSGYDSSREEGGAQGAGLHPDHAQRQQQLLQHQRQQQQQQFHRQQDQQLHTQYRLNTPQSDGALATAAPESDPSPAPPTPTNHRDLVTRQTLTRAAHTQTETDAAGGKAASEREESGSANSGDAAGAEPANQGLGRDSKVTSGDGHMTEEQRRQKLLEMVQSDVERPTLLHPHHPQHRPKPTSFRTVLPTAAPLTRQAPFRPASPRRRRKHRKRISKAAIRAMIM